MKYIIETFLLCLLYSNISCQDSILIKGKLVDEQFLKPIIFAKIAYENNEIQTDNLGNFVLKAALDSRVIKMKINALGYVSKELDIENDTTFKYVSLTSINTTSDLNEVSVSYGAKDIMKKVIKNIPNNYDVIGAHFFIQFSKILIDDTSYVLKDLAKLKFNYTENVSKIKNYLALNKIYLKNFSEELKKDNSDIIWHYQNPFKKLILYDLILNKSLILNQIDQNVYRLKLLQKTKDRNKTVYPIEFQTLDSSIIGYNGVLLIDSVSFAITQAQLYPNNLLRKIIAKNNNILDYFFVCSIDYECLNNHWNVKAIHQEGYTKIMLEKFKKIHQMNFLFDIINIDEKIPLDESINHFEKINPNKYLDEYKDIGSQTSWQPIFSLINSASFKTEFPWLNDFIVDGKL